MEEWQKYEIEFAAGIPQHIPLVFNGIADEESNPNALVYDIKTAHTTKIGESTVVNQGAIDAEVAEILFNGFYSTFSAKAKVIGYTDRQIFLP